MNQKDLKSMPTDSNIDVYLENIRKIRHIGTESHLPEGLVDSVMEHYLESLIDKRKKKSEEKVLGFKASKFIRQIVMFVKKACMLSMSVLVSVLLLYIILQHKPIQYFIQSKLQDFIYPGMKMLRKLFLPVISFYPSLTKFYDESCLVVNPFFRVPDMLCPCDNVRAILNLTGEDIKNDQFHSGIPYMIKSDKEGVSWDTLKSLYKNHSSIFDRDAPHLAVTANNHQAWSTPSLFFGIDWDIEDISRECNHVMWRCNRMEPTRLLRNAFGTPVGEPAYAAGVTIEKLVLVDGPKVPSYRLPATDGTTVFIQQSSGSRIIVLTPANECKEKCSSLSVELPTSHILWFSWWYWRASSLPTPGASSLSITYVGSYM